MKMENKDILTMTTKEKVKYFMQNPTQETSNCEKIAKKLNKHPVYIRELRREILKDNSKKGKIKQMVAK